jgi:hypothetical protein
MSKDLTKSKKISKDLTKLQKMSKEVSKNDSNFDSNGGNKLSKKLIYMTGMQNFFIFLKDLNKGQWLIAQLVEHSLSVMKDPGSNLGADIFSFRY